MLFDSFKLPAIAIAIVVYSAGVWHVASTYTDSTWAQKELERTEKFIAEQKQNQSLRDEVAKLLKDSLKQREDQSKVYTKELLNELAKDPRYKLCLTTDGVRSAIQRKLDSQSR